MLRSRDAVDDGIPNPRGQEMMIVSLVMVIIAAIMVFARIYTRLSISRTLSLDDYLIIITLAISLVMTGMFHGEYLNGFGLHLSQISQSRFLQAWKYFLANQILYKAAVCFAKLSMLFLYIRIFPNRNFRIAAWIIIFICIGAAIGTILPTIFACHPISKAWDITEKGTCIDTPAIWYSSSSINVGTDVMIIILPISQISSLKLRRAQKIGLGALFSLGIFIIATCLYRIATLGPAATATDPPYYQATNNLWLGIEVNTAIIVTCIPPLRTPLTKILPRCLKGSSYNQSSTPSEDQNEDGSRTRPYTNDYQRTFDESRASTKISDPVSPGKERSRSVVMQGIDTDIGGKPGCGYEARVEDAANNGAVNGGDHLAIKQVEVVIKAIEPPLNPVAGH